MIELSVKIKDDEITLSERFIIYEPITISRDDPLLSSLVEKVRDKFKGDIHNADMVLKFRYTW